MNPTATCTTCGTPVPASFVRSRRVCPACLMSASGRLCHGLGESGETSTATATTCWVDAFPQFEVESVLVEESDHWACLALDLAGALQPVVVQVVSGESLEKAGGVSTALGRVNRLRELALPDIAHILDAGDLADAFYLVTAREPGWEPLMGSILSAQSTLGGADLSAVMALTAETLAAAQLAGAAFRLDLRTTFRDEATGRVILTPVALPPYHGVGGSADRPTAATGAPALGAGSLLGPYRLDEHIGEGGFGEVWRAHQERPVARIVAVKLLKTAAATPRLLARFEVERQALARLDHPHIARFLDAGTAPDGRPFIAMEWVDGRTIGRHCEQEKLTLDARLRLFRGVAEAVEHAHQKGILHRDLKPSNVLVPRIAATSAASGGRGAPDGAGPAEVRVKVIDFGIARAFDDPMADATLLTRADELLGTPATMSPEQAAGRHGSELDVRTDVYGLGILLYELLTGQLPHDPGLPPDELRRRIREQDAPKPSVRAGNATTARRLRGELDWIVLKCLEKSPDRRYPGARALIDDIDRHLNDEPVLAGPPDWNYRARKLLRRHRVPATAAALLVVVLAGSTGVSLWQAGRARAHSHEARAAEMEASARRVEAEKRRAEATEARDAAEAMARFLTGVFRSPDPAADGRAITVAALLDQAVKNIQEDSSLAALARGRFLLALGETYSQLSLDEDAMRVLQDAVRLLEGGLGAEHTECLRARLALAGAQRGYGMFSEAVATAARVVDLCRRSLPAEHPDGIKAENTLAGCQLAAGLFHEADQILKPLVSRASDVFGPNSPEVHAVLENRARTLEWTGRYEEANAQWSELVTRYQASDGPEHPRTVRAKCELGWSLVLMDSSAAACHFSSLQPEALRVFGADHSETLSVQHGLAEALLFGPDKEAGLKAMEAVHMATVNLHGKDHPDSIQRAERVAWALRCTPGREKEAFEKYREVLTPGADRGGGRPLSMVRALAEAAGLAMELGELPEAAEWADRIPLLLKASGRFGADAIPSADARPMPSESGVRPAAVDLPSITRYELLALGVAFRERGQPKLAMKMIEIALKQAEAMHGPDALETVSTMRHLARAYLDAGRNAEACRLYEKVVRAYRRLHPEAWPHGELTGEWSAALRGDNRPLEAVPLLEIRLQLFEKRHGVGSDAARNGLIGLAKAWIEARHGSKAIEVLDELEKRDAVAGRSGTAKAIWSRFVTRGEALFWSGRRAEGLASLDAGIRELSALPGAEGGKELARAYCLLGYMLRWENRPDEAVAAYERGLGSLREVLPPGDFAADHDWRRLCEAYVAVDQPKKAWALWREMVEQRRRAFGEDDERTLNAELVGNPGWGGREGAAAVADRWAQWFDRPHTAMDDSFRRRALGQWIDACRAADRSERVAELQAERLRIAQAELTMAYADFASDEPGAAMTLVAPEAVWRWAAPEVSQADAVMRDLYAGFCHSDFDDAGWAEHAGTLVAGIGHHPNSPERDGMFFSRVFPAPAASGGRPPALFRHRFTTLQSHDNLELVLQVDDGAVVFLDGVEVARINVLDGPVTPRLPALGCRSGWTEPVRVALPGGLRAGEHVLAISLHEHDCWQRSLRLAGVTLVARDGKRVGSGVPGR